nr:unnamed protein product [Callosobruchus chinensis]
MQMLSFHRHVDLTRRDFPKKLLQSL